MAGIDEFVSFLREEETRSWDERLQAQRAVALDFYNGELFGDEEQGRSQVVTRDVAEVIDYMTVSTIRTMISGDRAVEFAHPDKAIAEQATITVGQTFAQGQRGYTFLHDWIKAGLLEKSSIAKCCVEPGKPKRIESTLSTDELTAMQQSGANIVGVQHAGSSSPDLHPDDPANQAFHVAWHEPGAVEFRDYVVPNEQCSFAQDATDLDEDAVYIGFHSWRTLSQLRSMGFDTDAIGDQAGASMENSTLSYARDLESRNLNIPVNRQGANRRVILHEEYARYDLDADGISELLLVHRVGNTILTRLDTGKLAIEPIDEQPGVSWCPFPMQHRIVGQSLADKVMDIQRTSSVLMRQALDNLYQSNSPRFAVSESSLADSTIDDLLTVRAGGVIRYSGAVAPTPIALPFAAQTAFDAMEILRGEKESRTGITRMNQGLDADALNKTATGTALMQAAGQQIEEYIARNFAEGFARLMLKKYRLMRQFGEPMQIVIDDQPVTVDPRQWPEDMQVTVRVGLGSGSKAERVQSRMTLLQIAQQAMAGGSRVFTEENLYNNLKGLVADTSLGPPRELITDPATLGPPPPPPPDPKMVQAQSDAMLQAEKIKGDQQHQANSLVLQQQQGEQKAQGEQARANADVEVQYAKLNMQAQLERERMQHEVELEFARMAHAKELALLKPDRTGGALDA